MDGFKPMMKIGTISIAQRIAATLRQAGIGKIVMVTGFHAAALERHLANQGIIFLRNEQFASTEMIDSAKIGLAYLRDKCDRVLFTPVDIPLFTAATVETLLNAPGPLAYPTSQGRSGHPIVLSAELIPPGSLPITAPESSGAYCPACPSPLPAFRWMTRVFSWMPTPWRTLKPFCNIITIS